jgi:hypothetical protein
VKFTAQSNLDTRRGKDLHVALLMKIEGADIIQARHVVFVLVCEEYSVEARNTVGQHLLAKIRAGIHDQAAG